MTGSVASSARRAALRPAASPSKAKTTWSVIRSSALTCAPVIAVPERRHGLAEARLRELDHVHVALDDDGAACLPDGVAPLVQAVEFLALVEDRRLRRVQVLRFARAHDPRAEADDLAARIANREHDPATKPVVPLAFVGDDEARFRKTRVVVVIEGGAQRLPRIRREAEREARGGLSGQAASLQVFDRRLAGLQLLAVELRRLRQHLGERTRLRLRLARARGSLRAPACPPSARDRGWRPRSRGRGAPSGSRSRCRAHRSRNSGRTASTG